MENDVMKIECLVREDGKTVARITAKSGDVTDLLPGESLKMTLKVEGSGGGGGSLAAYRNFMGGTHVVIGGGGGGPGSGPPGNPGSGGGGAGSAPVKIE